MLKLNSLTLFVGEFFFIFTRLRLNPILFVRIYSTLLILLAIFRKYKKRGCVGWKSYLH